jgi:hypothetical protein
MEHLESKLLTQTSLLDPMLQLLPTQRLGSKLLLLLEQPESLLLLRVGVFNSVEQAQTPLFQPTSLEWMGS